MASKGKKLFRWFIFIGIIVTAVISNPDKEKHIEKINEKVYDLVPKNRNSSIIEKVGKLVTNPILNELVRVDNYYVFSVSKIEMLGKSETISYGFFGLVFFTEKINDLDI